jgi:hypothetical protein
VPINSSYLGGIDWEDHGSRPDKPKKKKKHIAYTLNPSFVEGI